MINKKFTIILGIILLTGIAAFVVNAAGIVLLGGTSSVGVNDGLVSDLSLAQSNYNSGTKTFTDASRLGNNGTTLIAASFATDNYNKSNGAMSFTGSNHLSIPSLYNTSFPQTAGTIAIWVYGDFSNQSLKSIFDDYSDTRKHIFIRTRLENNGLQIVVQDPVGGYLASSYPTLENNKWSLIVVTYNNTTDKFNVYINGAQYSSDTMTDGSWVPNGQYAGSSVSNRFTGLISKVSIYNRDLSLGEIQSLYKPSALGGSSLNAGLVGYWPLDSDNYNSTTGRVTDKTPYQNNCTNNGASLITDRAGKTNGAMDFNGTTSYLDCGNGNSLQITGNQTYAFWIYPRTFVSRRNPIDKAYGGEGTITMEPSGYFNYYWGTGGGNASPYTSHASDGISANQWTHVVHVRDLTNNRMIWYMNGVPNSTSTPSYGAAVASSNSLSIGDGYVSPIDGSMADVRIYNRALSESEIQALYSAYRPKIMADSLQQGLVFDMPLTSAWTKTETAGSQIMTDKTPYSNDGQNYGATISSDGASFNGSSYMSIPSSIPATTGNQISVAQWYKPAAGSTDPRLVSRGWCSANGWLSHKNFGFGVNDGTGCSAQYWASYGAMTDGQWYFLVGIFDGTKTYGYKDGQLIGTTNAPGVNLNSNNYSTNLMNLNSGQISGVKVYNRALSVTEIKSLYDKGR